MIVYFKHESDRLGHVVADSVLHTDRSGHEVAMIVYYTHESDRSGHEVADSVLHTDRSGHEVAMIVYYTQIGQITRSVDTTVIWINGNNELIVVAAAGSFHVNPFSIFSC